MVRYWIIVSCIVCFHHYFPRIPLDDDVCSVAHCLRKSDTLYVYIQVVDIVDVHASDDFDGDVAMHRQLSRLWLSTLAAWIQFTIILFMYYFVYIPQYLTFISYYSNRCFLIILNGNIPKLTAGWNHYLGKLPLWLSLRMQKEWTSLNMISMCYSSTCCNVKI
jgi:hypothetical protein